MIEHSIFDFLIFFEFLFVCVLYCINDSTSFSVLVLYNKCFLGVYLIDVSYWLEFGFSEYYIKHLNIYKNLYG